MRVAIVSMYAPKACGIAVFSADLRAAIMAADPTVAVDLVAMVDDPARYTAAEISTTIRRDVGEDYGAAAAQLNASDVEVVLIEHEFGLFGGEAGAAVLDLAEAVGKPLVVTLHTVLSKPSYAQLEVLRRLGAIATLTVVFTETARRMIIAQAVAAPERVRVVPHGAPDLLLDAHHREPRPTPTTLSTFGLISTGKGIETAIAALPKVVARYPQVVYLVAGQTHPDVVRHDGESYRDGLHRLVQELDLEDNVRFIDRFSDEVEIGQLLGETDVYLTPYRSREQIVSGALTFAVAAGCPVVSTPYYYAEDLLSSGAGVLVPFGDSDAMAAAVLDLFDDPTRLAAARHEASRVGARLSWSQVGADSLAVLHEATQLVLSPGDHTRARRWPDVRTDHLRTLTDDVSIIEHARGAAPDRTSGYCTDDTARLVVVLLGLLRDHPTPWLSRTLARSLAFLWHARDPGQTGLRNRLSFERHWVDEPHDGDHLGRAVWALGAVLAEQPGEDLTGPAEQLLAELAPEVATATSPREVAYAVLGLSLPTAHRLPGTVTGLLAVLAERLSTRYSEAARPDWPWFEDYLTYDNARLPQALLAAGHRLSRPDLVEVGRRALDWYAEQSDISGPVVRLVGNRWRHRTDQRSGSASAHRDGDEQAIDAAALGEALLTAARVTGDARYLESAQQAFEWFLGRNRLGLAVYDARTGGCHDGLGQQALNHNQGAESTLAFHQLHLALRRAGLPRESPTIPPSPAD